MTEEGLPPTAAGMPRWEDLTGIQRREVIKPLWESGLSASQIAGYFTGFVTRNMVIGVIHRARWDRRPMKAKKPRANPMKRKRPLVKTELREARQVRPQAAPINVPPEPEEVPPDLRELIDGRRPPIPEVGPPIDIMQLPQRPGIRCRFPVQGGYCGAPSGDATYCAAHSRIAYTTPRGSMTIEGVRFVNRKHGGVYKEVLAAIAER